MEKGEEWQVSDGLSANYKNDVILHFDLLSYNYKCNNNFSKLWTMHFLDPSVCKGQR